MIDTVSFDPTEIKTVSDVVPRYEGRASTLDELDSVVDPNVLRDYTIEHLTYWLAIDKAAALASERQQLPDAEKPHVAHFMRDALFEVGLDGQIMGSDNFAACDYLKVTEGDDKATKGRAGGYLTNMPLMAPRHTGAVYRDFDWQRKAVDTVTAQAIVGDEIADRLARFDALEMLRQTPDFGRSVALPRTPENLVDSHVMDHVSALMDHAVAVGRSDRRAHYHNGEHVIVDYRDIGAPGLAVGMLEHSFAIYDEMTQEYPSGQNLEAVSEPLLKPEIALAREYISSATLLAQDYVVRFDRYKKRADDYFAVRAGVPSTHGYNNPGDQLSHADVDQRDLYGQAQADITALHERATTALLHKFAPRAQQLISQVGANTSARRKSGPLSPESQAYIYELAAIGNTLNASVSVDDLPVNSALEQQIASLVEEIQTKLPTEDTVHRYGKYIEFGIEYDSTKGHFNPTTKRLYRNYPPNVDAVEVGYEPKTR